MEVLDSIYDQFPLASRILLSKFTRSIFIQHCTLQTIVQITAVIYCWISEYATGKKIAVLFTHNQYHHKDFTSAGIHCTANATACINDPLVVNIIPLCSALLCRNRHCSNPPITFHCGFALPYLTQLLSIIFCTLHFEVVLHIRYVSIYECTLNIYHRKLYYVTMSIAIGSMLWSIQLIIRY